MKMREQDETRLSLLNTTMKSLSMRREALWRATLQGGSDQWDQHRDEINSINNSMDDIEGARWDLLERITRDTE